MGQQQLLLVILVTIIVGIATVVAINTFGSAADAANLDAVRNDIAAIASAAQGYYMKPEMLAGGGRTFTGITFNDFGFAANGVDADGLTAQNENGFYVLDASNAQRLIVTANPASDDAYTPGDVDNDGVLTGGDDA
ncbi:MAG: hypothetical protein ACFCU6_03290, partial [Balneolaceae bacterium]